MKIDDEEKFIFYLNAEFEIDNSLIFSNIIKKPSNDTLLELKQKMSSLQIERLFNHFHMSALSDDINIQKFCTIEIWKKWRFFFDTRMPKKDIVIEISDQKYETIIYVFQLR